MAPPNDFAPFAPPSGVSAAAGGRLDAAALQPQIGSLLHDVARLIRRGFERRARQSGLPLTRHQARTLLFIARNEGLSQAAVAARLDIEPIALVRLIDRLRLERLVERRRHPSDRRIRTLWLTAPGWAMINRVLAINGEIREELCAGLVPAQREMLLRTLLRMKDNLALAEEAAAAAAERAAAE